MNHNTARLAVQSIGRWWKKMGSKRHRSATKLSNMADGGRCRSSSRIRRRECCTVIQNCRLTAGG
ncbi:MAG: hypothetical protein HZB26_19120 [Candidatus Hydrogenedentes bacterium]|nr:hypothetical protein [Candidatus Hydrogenedentota bacterium]